MLGQPFRLWRRFRRAPPRPASGSGLRLTPRLIISIRSDGLQLQQGLQYGKNEVFRLRFPDLWLLSALDVDDVEDASPTICEIAAETRTDAAALRALVRELECSNRLVRAQRRAAPAAGQPARTEPLRAPGELELLTPMSFRLVSGSFETLDHDGRPVVRLSPAELHALGQLIEHSHPREALSAHVAEAGRHAVGEQRFMAVLGQLFQRGLLQPRRAPTSREGLDLQAIVSGGDQTAHGNERTKRNVFARHAAEQDARERSTHTGQHRPQVVPVAFDMGAPAGIGSVVAFAKAFDNARLDAFYNFRTDWIWDDERLESFTQEPAIYMFSNYLWSHERCIAVSQAVKERSPNSITIHGGPDTPKYEADLLGYFAAYPHVDIVVRGEGELSAAETLAALMPVIGDEPPNLSVLAGVKGIAYRDGDRVVRNPDRERINDLDSIPSPYLTGLFDAYIGMPGLMITLETNRGCPYGCTFCDWGSATASRVRKFDTQRVLAEIEWSARARANFLTIADANYGTFARDVEFAERAAELKSATGYPMAFGCNYAKNTVKHLRPIINVLAEAGVMTQGTLSLQSMDEQTLAAIERSNIKTEKYDALALEMHQANLPLMIELMMGLPGSTFDSFKQDLQQCIDRELPVRVNHTVLLVNSPMNDPAYLTAHQIKTASPIGPGKMPVLISTTTYTPEEYGHMDALRILYLLFENFGVLRLASRYVRHETGMREIDLYDRLRSDAADTAPWPTLHVLVSLGSSMMAPPVSWKLMVDELARYFVTALGMRDDDALQSVLTAQHALLPAHGRSYPCVVDLAHDVTEWAQRIAAAKHSGKRSSWMTEVPPLRELRPGKLTVDDPMNVTRRYLGVYRELNAFGINWELDSPLARARLDTRTPGRASVKVAVPSVDDRHLSSAAAAAARGVSQAR